MVSLGPTGHTPDFTYGDMEFHILNNTNTTLTLSTTKSIYAFAISGRTGSNISGYGYGSLAGTTLSNQTYSLSQSRDVALYNSSTTSVLRTEPGTSSFDLQARFSKLPSLKTVYTPQATLILYLVPLSNTSGVTFSNTNNVFVSSVSNIVPNTSPEIDTPSISNVSFSTVRAPNSNIAFNFNSSITTSGVLVLRYLYYTEDPLQGPFSDRGLLNIAGSSITSFSGGGLTTLRRGKFNYLSSFSENINTILPTATRQCLLFVPNNGGGIIVAGQSAVPSPVTISMSTIVGDPLTKKGRISYTLEAGSTRIDGILKLIIINTGASVNAFRRRLDWNGTLFSDCVRGINCTTGTTQYDSTDVRIGGTGTFTLSANTPSVHYYPSDTSGPHYYYTYTILIPDNGVPILKSPVKYFSAGYDYSIGYSSQDFKNELPYPNVDTSFI